MTRSVATDSGPRSFRTGLVLMNMTTWLYAVVVAAHSIS
jgi:hypothetical protein